MNQIQLKLDAWMGHLLVSISRLELLLERRSFISKVVVGAMVSTPKKFSIVAMIAPPQISVLLRNGSLAMITTTYLVLTLLKTSFTQTGTSL